MFSKFGEWSVAEARVMQLLSARNGGLFAPQTPASGRPPPFSIHRWSAKAGSRVGPPNSPTTDSDACSQPITGAQQSLATDSRMLKRFSSYVAGSLMQHGIV